MPRASPTAFRNALAHALTHGGVDLDRLGAGVSPQDFREIRLYRAFAQVRRRLPAQVSLDTGPLAAIVPGFEASTWSVPTVARAWLLHRVPDEVRASIVARLFAHASLDEQVALYRSLYTLPDTQGYAAQVAEGVRTNIVDVFDAVALHNPIAPCLLDEVGWHQLVLKALFLGRPLFRIHDLDARRTPDLARAALDYARERWAAGRPISPELWRLVAGHADLAPAEDLDRAEASADAADDSLTAEAVRLVREGVTDRLPWDRIGRHWEDAP